MSCTTIYLAVDKGDESQAFIVKKYLGC